MIIFLHGDNQVESRNRLHEFKIEAKSAEKEVLALDGNRMALDNFIQALEAQSLFSDKRLVVVENFISAKKNNTEAWEYLKDNEFTPDILIWESKKIDGRKLSWLRKNRQNKVEEHSLPNVLFQFLDSIGFPSKEKTLSLFEQTINKTPIELVYFMIVRQFRLLLLVKFNSTDVKIKETSRLQAWQLQRISRQTALFDQERLKKCYKKLLFIDYQQKTGQSTLDLKQTLDIFLTQL